MGYNSQTMIMKRISYIILGILILVGLISCEKVNEANLIGKWELQSVQDEYGGEVIWKSPSIWEFTKDHQVYINDEYFSKWSYDGKDIVVEMIATDNDGNILYTDYLTVDKLTSQMLILLSSAISSTEPIPCKWTFKKAK